MKNNPLKHPVFLLCLGSYLILFALKKSSVYLPLISEYAADLLAMPVVLSITLYGIRRSAEDRRNWTFPWTYIAFLVLFYSLLFELIFPILSPRFTADPWDVLAYAIGAVLFYFFLNGRQAQK